MTMKVENTKKLKKDIILEDTEIAANETELSVDDVEDTPKDELASTIQVATAVATDGKETYSDANADKIANELKTLAKGFNEAAWAPLDVTNALTKKLDHLLAKAMKKQKRGLSNGTDILVTGLPGSGKTAICRDWARSRGVNLVYIDAKDPDLDAVLRGFPVHRVLNPGTEDEKDIVTGAASDALDDLRQPNTVMFLDEFNRAAPTRRAVLLTLINEHAIRGRSKEPNSTNDGYIEFPNLLFTIACINPSSATDKGATPLNGAELSRFAVHMRWDSTPAAAEAYFNSYFPRIANSLDPNDPDYEEFYKGDMRAHNIGHALLTDLNFRFEDENETILAEREQKTPFDQRMLSNGLQIAGEEGKDSFLDWVDEDSNFRDPVKNMIHDILDDWEEPPVIVPGVDAAGSASKVNAEDTADDEDLSEFEDTEIDDDLFASKNVSAEAKAQIVSASDATQRIKGFDPTPFFAN